MMRVVATAVGYYGKILRQPGEEFDIADSKDFSDKWMAKAGSGARMAVAPVGEEGRAPRQTRRKTDLELQEEAITEAEARAKAAAEKAAADAASREAAVRERVAPGVAEPTPVDPEDEDAEREKAEDIIDGQPTDEDDDDKPAEDKKDDKPAEAPKAPLAMRRRPRA